MSELSNRNEYVFDKKIFYQRIEIAVSVWTKTRNQDCARSRNNGWEAYEFMEAFSRRFYVDVSNFRFEDYFEQEGDWILPAVIRFFTCKKKKKN